MSSETIQLRRELQEAQKEIEALKKDLATVSKAEIETHNKLKAATLEMEALKKATMSKDRSKDKNRWR